MPERYVEAIVKYLSSRGYQPLKPRQLARQLGVADAEYGSFRESIKQLHDAGRIVLGAKDALMLPSVGAQVTGTYRANARGFGFITPQTPTAHGDLYVPEGASGGAVNGDLVVASVHKRGQKDGRMLFAGTVLEILKRGTNRFVGTLRRTDATWFVMPDGKSMTTPIVVRDIGEAGPKEGDKVVAEIIKYATGRDFHTGVIVESLGAGGALEVETLAVIRAAGIEDVFSEEAMNDARAAIAAFDGETRDGREDLTGLTIVTIDPPDARDFDDAISITLGPDGQMTLGVHIADVSHFVREGSTLDEEARRRGTSTYFPRKVVPMLPEVLSNGVCSLQEGQRRYCKSAFITYDREAHIVGTRFAETVIASSRRLTYLQAQDICDGKVGGYAPAVVELMGHCLDLAQRIEKRRYAAGMLHLDLPEVELILDEHNKVVDAKPGDNAYTHTLIEMFMVEANDQVAALFDRLGRPCLRRIHPEPDATSSDQLGAFVRAAGHRLPKILGRRDVQDLLALVRGKPESYAINLAILKTFQQAVYSPMNIGHYALASQHYCHFTSPIRRYPDLTIHRLLAEYCRGRLETRPPEDMPGLIQLGEACTAAERRSEAAEGELREVLLLQMLAGRVGEEYAGVVTGVTNFGIFVQLTRFLIDGLIRLEHLGDDWWDVNARMGSVRGERTGQSYRIGDMMTVRIVGVDQARRQLNVLPASVARRKGGKKPSGQGGEQKGGQGRGRGGAARKGGKGRSGGSARKGPPKGKKARRPGKNERRKKK
ncbi:MAG: ribonuclease R [Phycisphaerae bacterium]|jgi:ribonuclease R